MIKVSANSMVRARMNDKYILDEKGNPVAEADLIKWEKWLETAERHVAKEQIGDSKISTVFLGFDHNFGGRGQPVLWETMVFGGALDPERDRCSGSRKQAEAMHARMVEIVRCSNDPHELPANGDSREAKDSMKTETMPPPCSRLLADGWREYPDQFRKYARCFFKRFDTPTRCACNADKAGMQICVSVSEYKGRSSYEIDLHGELPDGTWIKLHNLGMPESIEAGLATIPRLLATWEFICANEKLSDSRPL